MMMYLSGFQVIFITDDNSIVVYRLYRGHSLVTHTKMVYRLFRRCSFVHDDAVEVVFNM